MTTPLYSIGTWDTDKQAFTPQINIGMASLNITLYRLRVAMRRLRRIGYSCDYQRDSDGQADGDPSVIVERTDGKQISKIIKDWER